MRILNKKLAKMMAEKPIKANVTTDSNKLYLYGDIGDYWGGVTLDDVKNTVSGMSKDQVTVHINSYGGDATEGVAIRNFLMNNFEKIDVVIDGIAASSASIVALCGQTLVMQIGTTYMIHNPWSGVIGNRTDLLREASALESLEQSYRNVYMERFKGTEEELIELLENESWLTAEEAEQLGFANEVVQEAVVPEIRLEENLVASLLSKYAAKAITDDAKPNAIEIKPVTQVPEKNDEIKKPNMFLDNLTKAFSQYL